MSIEKIGQRIDEVTIAVSNLMDEIEEHYGINTSITDPRDWPEALTAASDLDVVKLQHYERIRRAIGGE